MEIQTDHEKQNAQGWIDKGNKVLMRTYSRLPVVMISGQGCRLKDMTGREFLDFVGGIAVCNLGHCFPPVTKAICEQAARLVHVSNLYYTVPQIELAELLVEHSFADRVFFANSGAEANEAAIKLARKYSNDHFGPGRFEIISLLGSFHGRTLATVAATGQPRFHKGFEPLPEGFCHAPFGDLSALERMISPRTCAILCEPIQGEGGVRLLSPEYAQGLQELCQKHRLLLIFDEVQVGMGRTGTLFCYEQLGVAPDILTSAKALGNGLPIGAMLATEAIAESFQPGTHASTFGGNPVAAAAAVVVMNTLLGPDFLAGVRDTGAYFAAELSTLAAAHPRFCEGVRGQGLIQALALTEEGKKRGEQMVNALFERGILANFAAASVLRFVPPLVVSRTDIDLLIDALGQILSLLT